MTRLDFDELNMLVDASLQVEDLEGLITTVRNLLRGAYQQAVLDTEEEFDYIYIYYPEMLGLALNQKTQGLTWEQRIRSWYKGENPNHIIASEPSEGGEIPPREGTARETTREASRTTPSTSGETQEETPKEETTGETGVPNVEAIKRVVETEYHRMYNTGAFDTATAFTLATGKTVYKRWDTMLDEKVRDTHSYLEGDLQPLDRAFFTFDGDSAMFPGGFTLPQNNINCRCTLSYELGNPVNISEGTL